MRAIVGVERPSDGLVVRVVELSGFGSRTSGEAVVAAADGTVLGGQILAGTVHAAIAEAIASGRTGRLRVAVSDPDAAGQGLACGGAADLFVAPVPSIPDAVHAAIEVSIPVVVVTSLATGETAAVVDAARPIGAPTLLEAAAGRAPSLLTAGRDTVVVDGDLMIEAVIPPTTVRIVGHAGVGEALASQAHLLGWSAETVDGADAARSAGAAQRSHDALVVLSHDPDVDTAALDAALRHGRGYVGALGSRHTQGARRHRLAALGHDAAAIETIHGPVGLDLGSRTPAETAVAIVAEIIAFRSGRSASSLRSSDGPING